MDFPEKASWDLLPSGKIKFFTITGFGVVNVDTGHVVLRINYAESQEHLDSILASQGSAKVLQVGLRPDVAVGIANQLLEFAGKTGPDPSQRVVN
ncbi:hypothetical protein [Rhizobium favelukesii]|uniref:hypothetical protein n=1 Tax=Rhizobium favelukesii TaxID=348824 RepID=UPI00216069FC|nr:hypothetical protein [Rhizobium favelukesii]MCS0459545.1 hypothetical protein [Rhizobium favelukesii]